MKKILCTILVVLIIYPICAQNPTPDEYFENVEKINIHSDILNEDRTLYIYTPENIDVKMHVLYLLDGQFWQLMDEAIESTKNNPHIIVGIRTVENRSRDMIPAKVESRESGGSKVFLDFFINELQPYINQNYPSSNQNILYGGSNAGLFTLYAMLNKPESFKGFISSSATIGYCKDFMENQINQFNPKSRFDGKFLYIYYGLKDPNPRVVGFIENYNKRLVNEFGDHLDIEIIELESEGHVPAGGIREGLKFIYKK